MKKAPPARKPNVAHLLFEKHLTELGVTFVKEHAFHPTRRWRWDYCFVLNQRKYAVEIQGGFYRGVGGHNSINGMQRDMEKQNHGVLCGYWPLRFSSADILRGRAKSFIQVHLIGDLRQR